MARFSPKRNLTSPLTAPMPFLVIAVCEKLSLEEELVIIYTLP